MKYIAALAVVSLLATFYPSICLGDGFWCYNCVEGVDDKCGDKFNIANVTMNYNVSCDDKSDPKHPCSPPFEGPCRFNQSIGCRKIRQEIDGVVHIVRQCAYSGGKLEGYKRTGNKGVRLYYDQCINEWNCNTAAPHRRRGLPTTVGAVLSSLLLAFIVGAQ